MRFGVGTLTADQAVALHRRYLPLYRDAKQQHRQSRGRASGWEPDDSFLQQLAPDQPTRTTKAQLQAIAKAIRMLLSGQWQARAVEDLEQASDNAQARMVVEGGQADLEAAVGGVELLKRISTALETAMESFLPAEWAKEQQRCVKASDRQLAWQLYAQGLSQREIALQCGHQQAWVSKLLDEKRRSGQIAAAAAAELARSPGFQACFVSAAALARLQDGLRNHLVEPEQVGGVAPLRLWIQRALETS
jgi:hypothetical protein